MKSAFVAVLPDHPAFTLAFGIVFVTAGAATFYWAVRQHEPWLERYYARTGTLPVPRMATPYAALMLVGGFIFLFGVFAFATFDTEGTAMGMSIGGGTFFAGLLFAHQGRALLKRDGIDTFTVWRGIVVGYGMALIGAAMLAFGVYEIVTNL